MVPNRPKYQFMREQAADFASFTPSTDVPNLKAWYRADTTTNSGGFVSQLTDKKGSLQYTQGTGSKQPALISSGSDPNGRACVLFDGLDDALVNATGHAAMNDSTVFMVTRSAVANPSSGARYLSMGNVSSDAKSFVISTGNSTLVDPVAYYTNPASSISYRAIETNALTTTVYTSSAPRIMCARHNSAASASATPITRSRLGVVATTNNGSSATVNTIDQLATAFGATKGGAGSFLNFGLYECFICNALLTDDQCRKVELYLAGYYGLV